MLRLPTDDQADNNLLLSLTHDPFYIIDDKNTRASARMHVNHQKDSKGF